MIRLLLDISIRRYIHFYQSFQFALINSNDELKRRDVSSDKDFHGEMAIARNQLENPGESSGEVREDRNQPYRDGREI